MRQFDLDRLAFDDLIEKIAEGACTPRGRIRLLEVQPFTDLTELERHQRLHTELERSLTADVRPPFEPLPDIDDCLERLQVAGVRLDGAGLWDLRLVTGALEAMNRYLQGGGTGALPTWLERYGRIASYQTEFEALDGALEPGGELRDDASPELARLRRAVNRAEERLRATAHTLAERLHREGVAAEPEPVLREGRFAIAVPAEQRRRLSGAALDRSRSGQTLFIEPDELADAALELRELRRDAEQEEERIRSELTSRCAERREDLETDLDRLAVLDAARAAALYTASGPLVLPLVSESGGLDLIEARHPLLASVHGTDEVVPLTLSLTPRERTLVISGPNAGGKTVALQTIGFCTALGLCGLPIPAAEPSRIPWIHRLHIDIGDEQSLEADLSTFTGRLRRLREMLADMSEGQLCLIDEAGSGTDPAQGAALAIAILEALTHAGAWTVCITHDGRIKNHAARTPGMGNGRMVFSDTALTPTYEFLAGEPGRSFAFEIAARSGLPDPIIERARDWLGPEERSLEEVLKETEALREELRTHTLSAERNARLARTERERYETLRAELDENARLERHRAAEEARAIIEGARRRIETAVREIRERSAEREAIKQAHAEVGRIEAEVGAIASDQAAGDRPQRQGELREGDRVMLRNLQRPATVLSTGAERIRVQAGSLSLDVDRAEIDPLPDEPTAVPRSGVRTPLKTVPDRLEIIGLRADEARRRVEKYLDDALLAGLGRVRIIHGSGAGVLRRVVAEVLREHPEVASFALEQGRPGGVGVTEVKLTGDES